MKYKTFSIKHFLVLCVIAFLAAGCGGSDSGGSNNSDGTLSGRGGLILRITDAPVKDADIAEVWVRFTQVIIHPADGRDDIVHDVEDASDPSNVLPYREIELKSLVAGKTSLLGNIPMDAGDYSWIRLVIDPENTRVMETSGAEYLVKCPSCTKSGFKLVRAFNVEATGLIDFTIDFDLRKSLTLRRPNKVREDFDYVLRPTLRILDTELASSFIHGMVEDQNPEIDPDVCWVYVYEGDAASTEPDDICLDPDTVACPLTDRPSTEAPVQFDSASGLYTYKTGPLMPGTYTVALVCEADDPDIDENLVFMQESEVQAEAVADGVRQDFILSSIAKLSLLKTLDGNADEDGSGSVTAEDTLTYRMHLSNEGNITLNNVDVTDPLTGLSPLDCDQALPAILAPAETLDCTATYSVETGDNIIVNTAKATADEVVNPVESSVEVEVDNFALPPPPITEFSFNFIGSVDNFEACPVWESFIEGSSSAAASEISIGGNLGETITCTDPTLVNQILSNLELARQDSTSIENAVVCDEYYWVTAGSCASTPELVVAPVASGQPKSCQCHSAADNIYVVRPCLRNFNWGGVGTNTCSAPSQTINVETR